MAGADGFAEVYPEDKYIVVQHLQAAGHVTGMTGDGVNDAPALRQAEVGIAVSTATDVAKGAASVVLTEPGLTNIVALVEQGRTIYQRILTWIINKISRTIFKAAFVAIGFMVTGKFVVSAFAMLLLVFMCLGVNDVLKVVMIKRRVLNAVAKKPVDLNPQIAKRAYELYEKRGRQDGRAFQDWDQAGDSKRWALRSGWIRLTCNKSEFRLRPNNYGGRRWSMLGVQEAMKEDRGKKAECRTRKKN